MPPLLLEAPILHQPVIVSHGMGVDSTAVLILLHRLGIRPDAVVHADTGSEWPETVAYREERRRWLRMVGFPELTIVRNPSPRARYVSLEENCLANRTMPSLAYGFIRHSCSITWKGKVIDTWVLAQPWAQESILSGMPVIRVIGYDHGNADRRRTFRSPAMTGQSRGPWTYWHPLQDHRLVRNDCIRLIQDQGLPVPVKSACFFCPATRKEEILILAHRHPQLAARALLMEAKAGHDLRSIKGLGGSFAWRDFLAEQVPELLQRLDQDYDTGHDLRQRYASGEEVWIPKRQRHLVRSAA